MVKCSKCGSENQPESFYCSNCGIPVRESKLEREAIPRFGLRAIIGILLGVLLFGIGLVIGLYGGDLSATDAMLIGVAIIVIGLVSIVVGTLVLKDR